MGWAWMSLIGLAVLLALRGGGFPRGALLPAGAAMLVGAGGYALQQRAGEPGRPAIAGAPNADFDPGMPPFRAAIMPGSPAETAVLLQADDLLRRGDSEAAANRILAALERRPGSAILWTGLGSALVAHDNNQVSPAVLHAFQRAFALAPNAPGPPFFLGQAYIESGDLDAAKRAWLRALALAPRDAPYRVAIAERLVLIDRFKTMTQ